MGRWIKVAKSGELSPGQGTTVAVGQRRVALFNDSGEYYAIDDVCPHQGGSLGEGILHDGRVICPLHSWIFELSTGRCPRDTHEPVPTFPTRASDTGIEVMLPGDAD